MVGLKYHSIINGELYVKRLNTDYGRIEILRLHSHALRPFVLNTDYGRIEMTRPSPTGADQTEPVKHGLW